MRYNTAKKNHPLRQAVQIALASALTLLTLACALALAGQIAVVAVLADALLGGVAFGVALLVRFVLLPSAPGLLLVRRRLARIAVQPLRNVVIEKLLRP